MELIKIVTKSKLVNHIVFRFKHLGEVFDKKNFKQNILK